MTIEVEIRHLSSRLNDRIILPDDPAYEAARAVWNGRIDRRPMLILPCASEPDVAAGIEFASRTGLPLSVRSGGHDFAGLGACEDGVMLDLSGMKTVRIDPDAKRAVIRPGVRWAEFDSATQKHALATTGGTVSSVGVAGFTLGGGTGYLSRRFGLGLDNLVAAQVVTAEGKPVRANQSENEDLFWGIRGGGGNFGVVTEFEFQLHRFGPEMYAGQIFYPFEDAPEALHTFRDVMAEAPDQLTCLACLLRVPPTDPFPAEFYGKIVVDLVLAYTGPVDDGEEVIRPFRTFSKPFLELVGPRTYLEVQQTFDAGVPAGQRWFSRAHYLDGISDESIEVLLRNADQMAGSFTLVYFEPLGGAIARVDPGATAFPHRKAAYSFHIMAGWTESGEDSNIMAWARAFHREMEPFSTGGVYVNQLSEDETRRIPAAFGENYLRLTQLKRAWDPDNLFRLNHNIPPAN